MSKEVYPSGNFKIPLTIFERMEQVGVVVPETDRYFPHFITYDFEAYMVASTSFENKHTPMSFSVCSNIAGLTEPVFSANPSPHTLVKEFLKTINELSDKSYGLLYPKYQPYFKLLSDKAEKIEKLETIDTTSSKNCLAKNNYRELNGGLEKWLRKIPVLGFNSQNYDLNMIKEPLISLLIQNGETTADVENAHELVDFGIEDKDFGSYLACVDDFSKLPSELSKKYGAQPMSTNNVHFTKKNNSFMAIETKSFRMLDISNYLSPTSYTDYLKALQQCIPPASSNQSQ